MRVWIFFVVDLDLLIREPFLSEPRTEVCEVVHRNSAVEFFFQLIGEVVISHFHIGKERVAALRWHLAGAKYGSE